jgi:hypothetical protein
MLYAISLSKTVSLYVFVVELDHFGVKRCKHYRIRGSKTLTFLKMRFYQGDLHLPGQRQCAMEWPTTVWQHCFTNIW